MYRSVPSLFGARRDELSCGRDTRPQLLYPDLTSLVLEANDYRLTFRLPNSPTWRCYEASTTAAARQELIRRCVLEATHNDPTRSC
jgi:hypothetical protein